MINLNSWEDNSLILGIDMGTSGVRVIAYDEELKVKAGAEKACQINIEKGGIVEQDVLEVMAATEDCINKVALKTEKIGRIVALALCGTVSSLIPLGYRKEESTSILPLKAAWLWADIRAEKEANKIKAEMGFRIYEKTGCPIHASYWSSKIPWMKNNSLISSQNRFAGMELKKLAGIKDYLFYLLTGEWITDQSMATATGLYNSKDKKWDSDIISYLGIDEEMLPEVASPLKKINITKSAAGRLGLSPDTQVILGASDGVLAHLGLGCRDSKTASCMIGTSGAVRFSSERRIIDKRGRTWSYPLVDKIWVTGGANNNGGNVLIWIKEIVENLLPEESDFKFTPDNFIKLAINSQRGAEGLIFLPYLYGERSPLWQEDLTGSLIGLSSRHDFKEIARSILEGICFGLNSIFRALNDQMARPVEIRASGGFIASPDWVQMLADIFGVKVVLTNQKQSAAAGAAMLGWHAIKQISIEKMAGKISVTRVFCPEEEAHQEYQIIYSKFQKLREVYTEVYRELVE